MSIIEVNKLTKEYQLGHIVGIKQTLFNMFARFQGKSIQERERFKALDDVSFTIEEGEVVGIIGHNGAGKSTLLKHLANISKPTNGSVKIGGTVAPLIEVGAGVNPELTGRENIFLNGAILGMSKKIIRQKLDEIIEFSELEQFIDTPVKRYSTGMKVKLGFSIATSMDAEILIIDEVLAVGDLAFQRKCFDRMEDLIKRQGRTVLLVSHNIRQIERMCSRVIILSHGKAIEDGEPHSVCDKFYQISNQEISHQQVQKKSQRIISSGEVENIEVDFIDKKGNKSKSILSGEALCIRVRFKLSQFFSNLEFHVGTHTSDFIYLTGESTAILQEDHEWTSGEHEIQQTIPVCPFVPGTYGVRVAVIDRTGRVLFHGENLNFFNVTSDSEDAPLQDELRLIDVPVEWKLDNVI